jgi:cytochrome c oxidase assembly protein subunit 15
MENSSRTSARRWTVAALVANIGIVVTGGIVRLSGSGLGCSDWPTCEGTSVAPPASEASWQTFVEFGNRLLTFVVLAACVGAWWAVRRLADDASPRARRLALALPVGVLAQAVLGGVTVLTGLHPLTVAAHFLLSAVLIAVATMLLDEVVRPGRTRVRGTALDRAGRLVVGLGGLVLVLGTIVTATGPHAGDPGTERLGFSIRHVTRLHSTSVWLVVAATVLVLVLARRAAARSTVGSGPDRTVRAVGVLLGLELAQGGVGYWQYFTGVPQSLVAVHLLLACLFWVAAVRVGLATTRTDGAATDEALAPSATLVGR